jgi:hypothetical protein
MMTTQETIAARVVLDIAGPQRTVVDGGYTIDHYLRQHGCRPETMIARLNDTIVSDPAVYFPMPSDGVGADLQWRGA